MTTWLHPGRASGKLLRPIDVHFIFDVPWHLLMFVAATVYACLAHLAACAVLWGSLPQAMLLRALVLWNVAAAALFLLLDPSLTLIVIACVTIALTPLSPAHRVAFFLVAVPCLPYLTVAPVPFPGLNYLTELSQLKICVLALLLPGLFATKPKGTPARGGAIAGAALVLYAIYTAIFVTANGNLTGGLRFFIDQLILLVLPFFAIRSAVRSVDDLDIVLQGFVVASLLLASIALMSTLRQWDFYLATVPITIMRIPDARSGFIRINATVSVHTLGMHLAAGLIVLQYLKHRIDFGFLRLNVMRLMMLAGIYFTDSRGSMGALCIAAGIYVIACLESRTLRILATGAVVAGLVAVLAWLSVAEFSNDGALGSISYRQQLLRVSLPYLKSHLLFGDFHFLQRKEFQVLVQGQGIIDITNLYLQIALPYGIIGLALLMMPFAVPLLFMFAFIRGQPTLHASSANRRKLRSADGSRKLIALIIFASVTAILIIGFITFVQLPQRSTVGSDEWLVALLPAEWLTAAILGVLIMIVGQRLVQVRHKKRSAENAGGGESESDNYRRLVGALTGIVAGWLFLMTTTSDVGLTMYVGLVFAALCLAFSEVLRSQAVRRPKASWQPDMHGGLVRGRSAATSRQSAGGSHDRGIARPAADV